MSPATEARVIVVLIVAVLGLSSAVIFYYGAATNRGLPAGVAVCSLALMGIVASHLILRHR